jgi:hypothetical protein
MMWMGNAAYFVTGLMRCSICASVPIGTIEPDTSCYCDSSSAPGDWVNCGLCGEWAHFGCDRRQGLGTFKVKRRISWFSLFKSYSLVS